MTVDALRCQRKIAQAIVAKGGSMLLVKESQAGLLVLLPVYFDPPLALCLPVQRPGDGIHSLAGRH